MDKPGPSNSAKTTCLICGMKTASCHLGVDACRACTIFYRRAKTKKMYACRSNTRRCGLKAEGGIACKRCRFDRFERILKESGAKDLLEPQSEREPSPSAIDSSPELNNPSPAPGLTTSDDRLLRTSSVASAFSPFSPSIRKERVLLEKCKTHYKSLSSMRRMCELSGRPNGPHPLEMNDVEFPLYPATFGALNAGTKIFLASVLEFAGKMFPEFTILLTREERWKLVVAFFYRFHPFESCYRAQRMFPDEPEKAFGCYTCYLSHDILEGFFDDHPDAEGKNIDEAINFMHDIPDRVIVPGRAAIRRTAPDDDEFHAVLVMLFWFTEGMEVREEIVQLADAYRAAVLQELHAYYREEHGLSDYATRIGELFMLILHFERNKDLKENFEICRMLGIFTDDSFMYQLNKQGI